MFASTSKNGRDYTVNTASFQSSYSFGHYMECIAGFMLMFRGLGVKHLDVGNGHDINAYNYRTKRTIKVEVKAARRNRLGYWQVNLRKRGHTDHTNADVIVMLLVNEDGMVTPYIVPTNVVSDINQIKITSTPDTYNGKFAAYRHAWNILQ